VSRAGGGVSSVRLSNRLTDSPCCLVGEEHSLTPQMEELMKRTASQLGKRPWGIGLLGFAPQAGLDALVAAIRAMARAMAALSGFLPGRELIA